jgi:hypothetical protein
MAKNRKQLPKHVNGFQNKRRPDKAVRYYFRMRGRKPIRLPGPLYSEAFNTAYAMALAGLPEHEPRQLGEKRTAPGTINALVVSYYRSTDWIALAEDTKDARRRIIEKFRLMHGGKHVHLLAEAHLVKIMNNIASPSARRSWLKAVRHLLRHAVPTMIKDNPTAAIAQVKLPKSKGHHTWTDDEIARYRLYCIGNSAPFSAWCLNLRWSCFPARRSCPVRAAALLCRRRGAATHPHRPHARVRGR